MPNTWCSTLQSCGVGQIRASPKHDVSTSQRRHAASLRTITGTQQRWHFQEFHCGMVVSMIRWRKYRPPLPFQLWKAKIYGSSGGGTSWVRSRPLQVRRKGFGSFGDLWRTVKVHQCEECRPWRGTTHSVNFASTISRLVPWAGWERSQPN